MRPHPSPSADRLTGAARGCRTAGTRRQEVETAYDLRHNGIRRRVRRDRDPRLVRSQRLEGGQLAGQERWRHEVTGPDRHPALDLVGVDPEMAEAEARPPLAQHVAIAPP